MRPYCKRGHKQEGENVFYRRWINGKLYPFCKPCDALSHKRFRAKKAALGLAQRQRLDGTYFRSSSVTGLRWKKRNPEKNRAHVKVYYALKAGKLIKGPCKECGATENVQAHHHRGYDHPLDVEWLCRHHHYLEHKTEMKRAS